MLPCNSAEYRKGNSQTSRVIPLMVGTITITPNGNTPETKMRGGMTVAEKKPLLQRKSEPADIIVPKQQTNRIARNSPKLSINERYRRLIPYMTFYYANDLVSTTTENYQEKTVEVAKAEILEAGTIRAQEREPKVIYDSRHKNIPIYQGNRLTPYNIASSNPSKTYYKTNPSPIYQHITKVPHNYNPSVLDAFDNRERVYERFIPKYLKTPNIPYNLVQRKPYLNFYQNQNIANVQYYSHEKEKSPIYKLIPYEQAPPVQVIPEVHHVASQKNPYNVLEVPNGAIYTSSRPDQHQYVNDDNYHHNQENIKKPPAIVSEIYYEKQPQISEQAQTIVLENGFKPIVGPPIETTQYRPDIDQETPVRLTENKPKLPDIETDISSEVENVHTSSYVTEQPIRYESSNKATLSDLIQSLQINKSIPKHITRENLGSSINTLMQVLNILKAQQDDFKSPGLSTPKFESPSTLASPTAEAEIDFQEEPYLAPVNTPSQHLDDFASGGSSSQRFPLPITSDDEGGTPGRPGADYPILTVIPPTKFDCKTQRYKGFFADPETRCQVWHYCDLNGGQASFLCPNGTIFSQAGLTCDWWFNVRCASTTQLYVLNESLYKYILPHNPKFPEDYSGPLVDKYLTLKFKEMEEQFRKNKNKQAEGNMDSNSTEDSDETDHKNSTEVEEMKSTQEDAVGQADVVVESAGLSGNVQRLQDD